VPISSTRSRRRGASASVIQATTYGCEIVCPLPMGNGPSWYACGRNGGGTNHSRGTHAIAASTRRSTTPRFVTCVTIMRWRRARVACPSIPETIGG